MGVIVGAAVGVIVFIILLIIITCVKFKKRRAISRQQNGNGKVDHESLRQTDALTPSNTTNIGTLGSTYHNHILPNNHQFHHHHTLTRINGNGNGNGSPGGHLVQSPEFLTYRHHYSIATDNNGLHTQAIGGITEMDRL
jgi:hypothetical protein